MGWCDAPGDRNYNRPVSLPYPASHEAMWRSDGLYDVVVTLSHNTRPRVAGGGSAVFFHLASDSLSPTAGCIAVRRRDVAKVLCYLGPGTELVTGTCPRRGARKSPSRPAPA
jgi:L,D-peptidoglycan transpeptidase YkuD (ErfK/YbiS/YcfS/YnhG family)